MKFNRPFLKWAGNKYLLLSRILNTLPKGDRFIEPFVGSGAVFLNVDYDAYLLMDVNHDLVNLYQTLKTEGQPFIDECKRYFNKKNNTESRYYYLREAFNESKLTHERAALFVYLNRHGYNGLCRYNSEGIFNVPFGRYDKPLFPLERMQQFHLKSKRAEIVCKNFLASKLTHFKAGDVCYCDPPYVPLSTSASFTRYAKHDFGEEEQQRLAKLAVDLSKRNVHVLVSNHDTEKTRQLYQSASIKSFDVARTISCDADSRRPVKELLASFQAMS